MNEKAPAGLFLPDASVVAESDAAENLGRAAAGRQSAPTGNNSRAPTQVDIAVGVRIRELRRRAGLTQREVSQHVGVTGAQFHRYERGLARISTGRLLRICEALAIPLEVFLEIGSREPQPNASSDAGLEALLAAYRNIPNEAQREALITIARSMARSSFTTAGGGP